MYKNLFRDLLKIDSWDPNLISEVRIHQAKTRAQESAF